MLRGSGEKECGTPGLEYSLSSPLPTPSSPVFASSSYFRKTLSRLWERTVFHVNSTLFAWPGGGQVVLWLHANGGDSVWVTARAVSTQ